MGPEQSALPGPDQPAIVNGLDPDAELPHAREIHTAFADERGDPRWIVEFHIGG